MNCSDSAINISFESRDNFNGYKRSNSSFGERINSIPVGWNSNVNTNYVSNHTDLYINTISLNSEENDQRDNVNQNISQRNVTESQLQQRNTYSHYKRYQHPYTSSHLVMTKIVTISYNC